MEEWRKLNKMRHLRMGDSVKIVYGDRNKTVTCYNPDKGRHGWCGTCIKTARRKESGYCPPADKQVSGTMDGRTVATSSL